MQPGAPFMYGDLARWPIGAEKAELVGGGLLFSGEFTEDDVARARRTHPHHEVRLDKNGLWVFPAGTSSVAEHLDTSVIRTLWLTLADTRRAAYGLVSGVWRP
jgi:hypothetical protein